MQWPLGNFRRRKVTEGGLEGYRFSRVSEDATAGFFFGFATVAGRLPGVRNPPEAVAYVFVEPPDSTLHEDLVRRRGSPVRRLVARGREMGYPFQFHLDDPVAALRHRSMARIPPELFVLSAADFFMNSQTAIRDGFPDAIVEATVRKGP